MDVALEGAVAEVFEALLQGATGDGLVRRWNDGTPSGIGYVGGRFASATSQLQRYLAALTRGELARWEDHERASIALLLLYRLRGSEVGSETVAEKLRFAAEAALERMLGRGFFRSLPASDAGVLTLATELLDARLLGRVGALGSKQPPAVAKRAPGPIPLPVAYRTQLYRLREALGLSHAPAVLLADVVAAEKAFRLRLPDRLLGLLATLNIPLRDVVSIAEEPEGYGELPDNAVPIGIATADGNHAMALFAGCNHDGSADDVFAWEYKSGSESAYRRGAAGPSDFATFLTWRWGRYETLENGEAPVDFKTPHADLDRVVPPDVLASFEPAIVATVTLGRVRHPKFGEGDVVSEGGGKCTVKFASGTKTLIASVLERL